MLCYVDIEHEVVLDDAVQRVSHLARRHDHQLRFEQIAGVPCLVQRYYNVSPARLRDWGIQAVIISGNATDWIHYDDAAFSDIYDVIREASLPLLGICGGCQLIAMAYGAAVGPIRKLRKGEPSAPPPTPPGYFKEWGFTPVHVRKPDPLFDGLGQTPIFLESHYWEIKDLPAGFETIASTDDTPVQALRQIGRPVYGVQFHPEGYTESVADRKNLLATAVYGDAPAPHEPDGRRLLANFFRIAGLNASPERPEL